MRPDLIATDGREGSVAVVGGGPAGLMAAELVASAGLRVTVYDRMPSVGRKLLMAGRGGLNLTHTEPFDRFLTRYGRAAAGLRPSLESFAPDDLRGWAASLGEPTTVGSCGRVFPASWKASPLLRAWLARLDAHGIRFALRHRWTGWGDGTTLRFAGPDGPVETTPDAAVLALGGGSWPRLGSDGTWQATFAEAGIATVPLAAANAGLLVGWSDMFRARFGGAPLKRIAVSVAGTTARGEAVVTRAGLEGGAVYAICGAARDALGRDGSATLRVDLRPDLTEAALAARLSASRGKQSVSTFLRKAAGLSPVATGLLREVGRGSLPGEAAELARLVKAVPLPLAGIAGLDRAISSAGGVAWTEVDERFMLRRRPGVFVAGEMLDWEAPTGGYLLQGCFATGAAAAAGALGWLRDRGGSAPPVRADDLSDGRPSSRRDATTMSGAE